MKTYEEALRFRAKSIERFAYHNSELCDQSGVGFWPAPMLMPLIFSRCISLMQCEIVKQHKEKSFVLCQNLTMVRNLLVKLAAEGDLGQDHVSIYMEEHPEVCMWELQDGPFYKPYERVLELSSSFKILGFLYSIEVGSLLFVKELVKNQLIKDGKFAAMHLEVEGEHHDLALSIHKVVMDESFPSRYRADFVSGCELHDSIYDQISLL